MRTRKQRILDRLALDGVVRVTQLSRELKVTPVTVRSDLTELEQQGLLNRTQGGAVPALAYPLTRLSVANSPHREEKLRLGEAMADFVADGETLFINSGTTTLCAAVSLKRRKSLAVVTNSIAIAMELGEHPGIRVILLGGEINSQFGFSYGADAQAQLSRYKADKALLSIDGIVPGSAGLSTYHAQEAMLDTLMMERAKKSFVLADESKIGKQSFSVVGSMKQVDTILTNQNADVTIVEQLREQGVHVVLA